MTISTLTIYQTPKMENSNLCSKGEYYQIEQFGSMLEDEFSLSRARISHNSEGALGDDRRKKSESVEIWPPVLMTTQFIQSNSFTAYCESVDASHSMRELAIGKRPESSTSVGIDDLAVNVGVLRTGWKAQIEHGELFDTLNNSVKFEQKKSDILTIKEDAPQYILNIPTIDTNVLINNGTDFAKYNQNLYTESVSQSETAKFVASISNIASHLVYGNICSFSGNETREISFKFSIDNESSFKFKIIVANKKLEFKLISSEFSLIEYLSKKIEILFDENTNTLVKKYFSKQNFSENGNIVSSKYIRYYFPDKRNSSRRSDRLNVTILEEDPVYVNKFDIASRQNSI